MTNAMSDKSTEGQASTEIEVTDAMLDAGVKSLCSFSFSDLSAGWVSSAELALEVYRRMEETRRSAGHKSSDLDVG